MKPTLRMLVALGAATCSLGASAHGGGLNADGCHVNRKTGDYHCHRSPAKSPISESYATAQAVAPLATGAQRSTRGAAAFANCAEARAAGAAPVRIGEPGYGAHLDRDGDGIGCEPYRGRR
ncbi:excalibur calcium-binding domain-containing protein [Massilia sp. BSC265]|uniref:excalibur calcium-binding domain-containing protein n=1 Tax=Massilia sp. BSC265 TaxID=1549812 RepID=UPI001E3620AC|nr:excalibur calcium-binding domain-containing protein [Massilia sp. BSC265]